MSNPFVVCHLPKSMIKDIYEEVLEYDEDGMVPLRTEWQGTGIVNINGREITFFASEDMNHQDSWTCQRQCEDAAEIATELEKMGISAHVIN